MCVFRLMDTQEETSNYPGEMPTATKGLSIVSPSILPLPRHLFLEAKRIIRVLTRVVLNPGYTGRLQTTTRALKLLLELSTVTKGPERRSVEFYIVGVCFGSRNSAMLTLPAAPLFY